MQIGIDFGSTYSTISRFDPSSDNVKTITQGPGTPGEIPSVVSIHQRKGTVDCGLLAKDHIGKGAYRIYEAFKMLLVSADEEMLRARGYDAEHTPQAIAKIYLKTIINDALNSEKENRIENLVICVPNIWSTKQSTKDGRRILREILKDSDLPIGDVQVVEEPEAASAFFAYRLEQATKGAFNGHLLLIDYGGGTLDLTLTQVTSDGKGWMEIGHREDGGAGENHPGQDGKGVIGSAGFAYMQAVVILAMREAGILQPEETPEFTDTEFVEAVRELERNLILNRKRVEDCFHEYGTRFRKMAAILKDEPREFISLEYRDEDFSITFQQMYQAYRDTIADELAREIQSINAKTRPHIHADPCDPASGQNGDFKIALVGGFNSFCLVRAQLAEIYNFDNNPDVDPRLSNIPQDLQIRAISLGAALIAAGRVKRQRIAHYSIGLRNAKGAVGFGIKYHQILEPDTPSFILRRGKTEDVPENRVVWANLRGNITEFAIEFTERRDHCQRMLLQKESLEQLKDLPVYGTYWCGFSLGEDEVITFHAVPVITPGSNNDYVEKKIRLDSYSGMFGLTDVEEVEVREI